MRRTTPFVLLAASAVLAAPVPKAVKSPPWEGRWKVVECRVSHADVTQGNVRVWEVRGESLTIFNFEGYVLTAERPDDRLSLVRLTAGGKNAVDFVIVEKDGPTRTFKGLAEVDGDEFVLCYAGESQPRPTELKVADDVIYRRMKRLEEK